MIEIPEIAHGGEFGLLKLYELYVLS